MQLLCSIWAKHPNTTLFQVILDGNMDERASQIEKKAKEIIGQSYPVIIWGRCIGIVAIADEEQGKYPTNAISVIGGD